MPWASNSSTLYAVWICLILWAEGAHFVVIPSALKEIYGKEADTIYALIFSYSVCKLQPSKYIIYREGRKKE